AAILFYACAVLSESKRSLVTRRRSIQVHAANSTNPRCFLRETSTQQAREKEDNDIAQ
ncbi:hypothetical protein OS493_035760, partial [Desmophyllum pertusum]